LRVSANQGRPARRDQLLESIGIKLVLIQAEAVTRTPVLEPQTIRTQRISKPRYVHMKSMSSRLRHVPRPKVLHQSIGGDHLAGADEEASE
jgi:hypothetical protein